MGITIKSKQCWNADNLDDFVASMNKVLWPNIMYNRRSTIFSADTEAQSEHLDSDNGDCAFCREAAYRTCAIKIMAGVLDEIEARYAASQAPLQKTRKGSGFTVHLLQPHPITNKAQLPNWVRWPEILDAHLRERVVNIIRDLNHSSKTTWHLDIPVQERICIIHAHMQRRFTKRMTAAVVGKQPMGALFYLFDPSCVVNLRSKVNQEIKARREIHPSIWHRTNGIWIVVKYVLTKLLENYEADEEMIPTRKREKLLGWLKDHIMPSETSSSTSSIISPRQMYSRTYSV